MWFSLDYPLTILRSVYQRIVWLLVRIVLGSKKKADKRPTSTALRNESVDCNKSSLYRSARMWCAEYASLVLCT